MPYATPVADALEQLRLAEARLERRRVAAAVPTATERAALRHVFACADRGEPVTPSALGAHIGLSRPQVSVMLRRLVSQGLVAERQHPKDGRSKTVHPIDRNEHLDGDDAVTDAIREEASLLSDGDARVVLRFVDRLREIVDGAVRR